MRPYQTSDQLHAQPGSIDRVKHQADQHSSPDQCPDQVSSLT